MDYNLYNIDEVEIPFSTDWNNIAISLSGGADSILCGMLERDYDCYFFNYGQTYMLPEFKCALEFTQKNKINFLTCSSELLSVKMLDRILTK